MEVPVCNEVRQTFHLKIERWN